MMFTEIISWLRTASFMTCLDIQRNSKTITIIQARWGWAILWVAVGDSVGVMKRLLKAERCEGWKLGGLVNKLGHAWAEEAGCKV